MRVSRVNKVIAGILAAGVALTLTGCGDASETESADAETETVEEKVLPGDQEFKTVVELRDAAAELGFPCPDWEETNQVTLAAGSGTCSSRSVLSVYTGEANRDEAVQNLKTFPGAEDLGGEIVVGPNWIINTDDAEHWATILGAMPVVWGEADDAPKASLSPRGSLRLPQ